MACGQREKFKHFYLDKIEQASNYFYLSIHQNFKIIKNDYHFYKKRIKTEIKVKTKLYYFCISPKITLL